MENKKTCKACKKEKDLEKEFYKSKGAHHSWCKKCMNFYSRAWAKEHKIERKREKPRES